MFWIHFVGTLVAIIIYFTMGHLLYGLTQGFLTKVITLFSLLALAAYDPGLGGIFAVLYMFLAQKAAVHFYEGATDMTGAVAAADTTSAEPAADAPIADKTEDNDNVQLQSLIRRSYCENNQLKTGKTFPTDVFKLKDCTDPCDPKCKYTTSDGSELITIEQLLRSRDSNKTAA